MATIDLLDSPRRWLWCALGWGSLVEEDGDTGAVPEAREKRGGWQGESWRGRLCLTLLSDWCTRGLHLKDQVVFIQLEKHWGHPKKGEILKKILRNVNDHSEIFLFDSFSFTLHQYIYKAVVLLLSGLLRFFVIFWFKEGGEVKDLLFDPQLVEGDQF